MLVNIVLLQKWLLRCQVIVTKDIACDQQEDFRPHTAWNGKDCIEELSKNDGHREKKRLAIQRRFFSIRIKLGGFYFVVSH
jgi:hypothetical protein